MFTVVENKGDDETPTINAADKNSIVMEIKLMVLVKLIV